MTDLQIRVQETPNPDAWKYILSKPVKTDGKASFSRGEETHDAYLAHDLLMIPGVSQVHFFENVITVTKDSGEWATLDPQVRAVIETRIPIHNPNFRGVVDESARRAALSPELQKIEEILDRTIRPGLQGDGGDLEAIKLEGKTLTIRYQGACGSCPSALTGTLYAIEDILKAEYDPELTLALDEGLYF